MSAHSYLVAWAWYLVAVVGLIVVWWRMTRSLPALPRNLLRVLPVAWALVPWHVSVDHDVLAPAWLVMIFEGLLREDGSAWRAGQGLLIGTLVALVPVAVLWWRSRRGAPVTQQHEQEGRHRGE